jgi:adenosylcobyric acid synthase
VPWLPAAARLPAEDSVALERMSRDGERGRLKVVVPLLGRIANFDDLDPLAAEPAVDLVYLRPDEPWPVEASLVVLPGSKSTIGDLQSLRDAGLDAAVRAHHARGGHVIGLCGGYQMLGRRVRDPLMAEGSGEEIEGIGLLDIETVMAPDKTVRNVRAHSAVFDAELEGYEIHLGETSGPDCQRPPLTIGERPDGAMSADGRVIGTYLHGLFANDAFRAAYLRKLGADVTLSSHDQQVETALDAIADQLAEVVDVDGLLAIAASRSS